MVLLQGAVWERGGLARLPRARRQGRLGKIVQMLLCGGKSQRTKHLRPSVGEALLKNHNNPTRSAVIPDQSQSWKSARQLWELAKQ